ncbi:MAG: hypothetical protein U0941_04270 [Planctomycetaceae bacterium]
MWTRLWIWLLTRLGQDPRGLFVFFDGCRWRAVDPLQVTRDLFSHPQFDWDETPKLLMTGKATVQLEAFRLIGCAVRSAFGIPGVDSGGLTERECLDLLTGFRQYLGDVKKNGSLFPTLSDSTDQPSAEESPTKPDSDSGSTVVERSCELPGSPAEPTSGG